MSGPARENPEKSEQTIHFVSLGCPKNRVDTEVMVGVAEAAGLELVADAEDADVVVVNTCGFIGEAKKESVDTVLEMAELRAHGRMKRLVVAGCLSQRYADELAKELPEVDHFLGSSDMLKLGEVLRRGGAAERMLVGNPAQWVIGKSDPRVLSQARHSAYVKIAEGCNRSCSFCAIPSMRGKQRSRAVDDVVAEVESLVAQGVVEVNLISQDTISYGKDLPGHSEGKAEGARLADLVEKVADVAGLRWLRLFYLYPEKLDDRLVELVAQHPRVVPYVDMPLQHASDRMLKAMRRGHGLDRQRRVVERLRKAIPGLTFRTAFIVGHPGEAEADFAELLEFVKWAEFERLAAFRYSDEEDTHAVTLDDKVPAKTAASRHRKLMSTQKAIAHKKHKALIGQELEVLVEGVSDEHEYVQMARHAGQAPEIDGQVYLEGPEVAEVHAGEIRRVVVTQAADYDLVGELLPRSEDEAAAAQRRAGILARVAKATKPRVTLPVVGDIAGR